MPCDQTRSVSTNKSRSLHEGEGKTIHVLLPMDESNSGILWMYSSISKTVMEVVGEWTHGYFNPVSYTHLTLPPILLV